MSGVRRLLAVGNRARGDDAAALEVLTRLRPLLPPDVRCEALEGAPFELAERWGPADEVTLLDATAPTASGPGTLHRFDARSAPLPASLFALSTHAFGLAQGVELARALGRLPRSLIVYGLEGHEFGPGAPLSPPVAQAVADLADRLLQELAPHA